MKNEEIKNMATIIYEYLLKQPDGYRTSTSQVIKHLGIITDGYDDDWSIHNALFDLADKYSSIILDMSEHEGRCEGLPFCLGYIVKHKNN